MKLSSSALQRAWVSRCRFHLSTICIAFQNHCIFPRKWSSDQYSDLFPEWFIVKLQHPRFILSYIQQKMKPFGFRYVGLESAGRVTDRTASANESCENGRKPLRRIFRAKDSLEENWAVVLCRAHVSPLPFILFRECIIVSIWQITELAVYIPYILQSGIIDYGRVMLC